MSKVLISLMTAAALGGAYAAVSAPAAVQAGGEVRIAEIIVYGDDPCPRSTESEVVVCARKPEAERYRIPEVYRESGPRQTRESWVARAKSFEYVGRTGTQSCSAVGPGGFTGCLQNMIDQAKAEARADSTKAVPPPESLPPGS